MAAKKYQSEDEQIKLRDILDDVVAGRTGSIIERHGKPAAVVISYAQWQAWQRQLSEEIERIRKEMDQGEYLTQEEVETGLRERGLL